MFLEVVMALLMLWLIYRLAELQKHGEEDWKKKVPRLQKKNSNEENDEPTAAIKPPAVIGSKRIIEPAGGLEVGVPEAALRTKSTANRLATPSATAPAYNRSVSLSDRVEQLKNAQNSWQNKVTTEKADADKFTVAGKMGVTAAPVTPTAPAPTPVTPSVPPTVAVVGTSGSLTPKPKTFKTSPPPTPTVATAPSPSRLHSDGDDNPTVVLSGTVVDHADIDSFFETGATNQTQVKFIKSSNSTKLS